MLDGDTPPEPTAEFDVLPLWSDDDDDLDDTQETHIVSDPLPDDELTVTVDLDDADRDEDDADGDDAEPDDDQPRPPDATAAPPPTGAPVRPSGDSDEPEPGAPRSRGAGLFRFVVILGFAAVLVLGFAILAAWARSGYFVAFDEDDRVTIYQGREDGFLWFQPTVEAFGQYTRDELTPESVALVEDRVHFESQDNAARFVAERLRPLGADSTDGDDSTEPAARGGPDDADGPDEPDEPDGG